ncbi:MAG: hypothetical protein KGR26_13855 [Cyanobacteria bacterium REEB65]|nr:hypothetical protein [Cyanobacteria bacterium REEB65]
MWIFHPLGFCSVVKDRERSGNLLCRARVRRDLEQLFPGRKVAITPLSDYRFRVSVPREEVARRVTELLLRIDYGNFKDACPADRHRSYLDIWSIMYCLQLQTSARRPRPRARKIYDLPL